MAGQTKPSAVDDILAEHAGLEQQLSDPALHNDPAAARRVGKRFAELAPVMATYTKLKTAREDLEAAYEAHRLLAADLDIACGTRRYGAPDSESWWAASNDDVSLERALATAAGVAPATLPALRYLARHELMTAPNEISASAVALEQYVAPAGTVRAVRTRTRLARLGRMIREDVGLAAANLHRIPQFIERRWPGVLPFGKGAA